MELADLNWGVTDVRSYEDYKANVESDQFKERVAAGQAERAEQAKGLRASGLKFDEMLAEKLEAKSKEVEGWKPLTKAAFAKQFGEGIIVRYTASEGDVVGEPIEYKELAERFVQASGGFTLEEHIEEQGGVESLLSPKPEEDEEVGDEVTIA